MEHRSSWMGAVAALLLGASLAAGCKTVPAAAPPVVEPAEPYTAAQVAVLRRNGFHLVDGNWELGIEDKLLFDPGAASLAPGRQAVVERLVRALSAVGIRGGLLEGHTDSTGSEAYNQGLSRARAEAVKAAMVAGGMKDDDIRLVALGEGYPVQPNTTPGGRSKNRRVVLIVTPSDVGLKPPAVPE